MTYPSLPFAFGLSVRPVLKPKGFEDVDGHHLPIERRTDADADGRADARQMTVVAELPDDFGKNKGM
jgi:hypothetical protein